MKKTYYFPNECTPDIFGISPAICIDYAECKRLAKEYCKSLKEFMKNMHEATQAEIHACGVYDS